MTNHAKAMAGPSADPAFRDLAASIKGTADALQDVAKGLSDIADAINGLDLGDGPGAARKPADPVDRFINEGNPNTQPRHTAP